MVEREIRSREDIVDLICLLKKRRKVSIKEISKTSGVTTIMTWKSGKAMPRLDNLIKVLMALNVEIVLSTNEFEKKVLSSEDIVNFIYEIITIKNLRKKEISKKAGIHINALALWKNKGVNPYLESTLKVLSVLEAKMVLCTYDLEEECAEGESQKTEKVEAMDAEYSETEISELDMLILNSAEKALKNCNSLSEKERLYKILQAFL